MLYNGILKDTDYKSALAKKGIVEAMLVAQKAGFENLANVGAIQKKETGEAQAATDVRDTALHTFEEWMSDFKELAKVALSDSPQLREQLGWKE